MTRRSRLRTKGDRRRRLFTLVLLCLAGAGVVMLLTNIYRPHLIDQFRESWRVGSAGGGRAQAQVRGTIYDRNYKELAVSYERVSVYANIREIDDLDQVVTSLAAVLEESSETLLERLSGNTLRLWLAKDISQEQEEQIRKLDLAGIFFYKEFIRYYPSGESGAHLIGFVENDSGLSGVEYYLDQLQTRYRISRERTDGLLKVADGRPGPDGQHLVLTLDLKIQRILDRFLEKNFKSEGKQRSGLLVMEAESGGLIGYSQVPTFDPNRFHTFPKSVFSDIFTTPVAVPDSFRTFFRELAAVKSAMDENAGLLPWSVIAGGGKLGSQLKLWELLGAGGAGSYDFKNFSSALPAAENFRSFAASAREYETVPSILTPLQLITAVGRAVNGGHKIIPHAGDRYILRDNHSEFMLEEVRGSIEGNILDKKLSDEAGLLFEAVGASAKLGTSILSGEASSYVQGEPGSLKSHRISVVLIPAKSPELVVMMVTETPGYQTAGKDQATGLYGIENIIAPVSALQQVMKNLADMMHPADIEEKNFQGQQPAVDNDGNAVNSMQQSLVITRMPDLKGMSLRKSLRLLQDVGVEIEVKGTGIVVSHQPVPGSVLVSGTRVVLMLERGMSEVPGYQPDEEENRAGKRP